ncbi:MAG: UTP--glucose-1-phosphate uridylyltransferase [Anaerolineales bacterium]|nr:UTP--glucose-1-phosphate uridylyltransferase [Anaerolineales bacterium]
MKAVILAGGKGARLAPYTKILPKPLMPIGDMPILEVLLRQLKFAGVKDVVITVGHLASLLRTYFTDGSEFGLNISYSHEEKPLGTAGPLSLIPALNETFFVMNGDVLTTLKFRNLLQFHKSQGAVATIASHQRTVKIDLGVLQHADGDYRVTNYVEKPTYDYLVSMGIYVFEPQALELIPHNEYLDFPSLVLKLIAADKKVCYLPHDGYWKDLGRPDDYEQAAQDFESMRREFLPED